MRTTLSIGTSAITATAVVNAGVSVKSTIVATVDLHHRIVATVVVQIDNDNQAV